MKARLLAPAAVLAAASAVLTGCTDNTTAASGDGAIDVVSTAEACTVSTTSAPGGTLKFNVKNDGSEEFAAAFAAGDGDKARELYAATRMHWERIEPVAESFGDLDPILDAREADHEEGQEWTGWPRAEKDLWQPESGYTPLTEAERQEIADRMAADTKELYERTQDLEFTPDKLANGAKELLDEVATGKVTGEEEIWSHTDLWDFQANLEGARIAYEDLRPLLAGTEDGLDASLEKNFAGLQALLDQYRVEDGFKYYDELTQEQVQELSAAVDALSEPLSKLTAAVVK